MINHTIALCLLKEIKIAKFHSYNKVNIKIALNKRIKKIKYSLIIIMKINFKLVRKIIKNKEKNDN